ncbi:MAG: SufD family Fe-S cluster assembly protein [Clostridium sp.]|nr:SufD family Fe-S cluster assembly protein [Clostridium sp.]
MGQGIDLTVNRLPVKTWNRLNMNEAGLKQIEAGEAPSVITEGFAEPETWNGAFPAIATGMGRDMDRLAEEAGTPAIRIISGPSGKEGRALLHFACGSGARSFQPVEILIRENETLTVIMDYTSAGDAAGMAAVQTRFKAERNARLRLIQLQFLGRDYTLLNDIGGSCGEGASAEVIQMFLGGAETYSGCQADLAGKESVFSADIGYLGKGGRRFDMNYVAEHRGEKSRSRIEAGGVLRNRDFKLFRGTINFINGAIGAQGEEKEDVLLLGEHVVNQTIPLILCGEEDVQGSHGATIGRLDEELVFYLCSRGMSREEAGEMIARARLDAVCRKIEDKAAQQLVQDYLEEVREIGA